MVTLGGVAVAADSGGQRLVQFRGFGLEVGGGHGLAVERGELVVADLDLGDRASRRGFVLVVHRVAGHEGFHDVARAGERGRAHRVELERASARVGDDRDRGCRLGLFQRRVGEVGSLP
ncbi:hypothetical protein G6F65_022534 [Rhizopus arrhizus]|nr:hypothetical protein G6F65_022534 [Rhizopus arrhizus]